MLSESNDVASSQQESVHQTHVLDNTQKNNWPMLNFIVELATCFGFTLSSHGQSVVKAHTAQSLYQILINDDPCRCLRKHRWLPESEIPPIPLGVKVKVVFLNFLVSIESLFHISECTDDPCHPCLLQSLARMASIITKNCVIYLKFPATQAGACWFTAQINDRHSGYWIRCMIKKPILAPNQPQNVSYQNWISNLFSFHKKGCLKTLNMQQQNGLN